MSRFDYFNIREADMFSFIKIPKYLLVSDTYKELSIWACCVYGWMLDMLLFSVKNGIF